MDKKLINLQMPIKMIDKMKEYASNHGLSVSMLIRLAVEEYMNSHS